MNNLFDKKLSTYYLVVIINDIIYGNLVLGMQNQLLAAFPTQPIPSCHLSFHSTHKTNFLLLTFILPFCKKEQNSLYHHYIHFFFLWLCWD